MKIANMDRLESYAGMRNLEAKSLIDGGMILQWSFVPKAQKGSDFILPSVDHQGKTYTIARQPTQKEYQDMLFGWLVESGITSNSVIYVKDGVTVGIGTGEQDRVGVAEIARDKAYRKYADRLCWQRYETPYNALADGDERKEEIDGETAAEHGGLTGSVMISDAFFPFRDGVDVGLREGVAGVLQPGGALRDYEVIEACNEAGASMMFTGQRSFRH
jgi:phosphoribosylaminoimidazolecarboxamide formyltransferase/IMP cyclohydrolase